MNPADLIQSLESDALYTEAMLANDPGSLARRFSRHPAFRNLCQFMGESRGNADLLVRYARRELNAQANERERPANEAAVASILLALSAAPVPGARGLLHEVSKTSRPSLTWLRSFAQFLLRQHPEQTRSLTFHG